MKQSLVLLLFFGLLLASNLLYADQPYVTTRVLSVDMANKVAVSAAKQCRKKGFQVAVAVVDRTGNLLAFLRDPLAGAHTIEVSQRKAYTAATFQSPTGSLAVNRELRFIPGVLLLRGGLPIRIGGQFYGAVGVSGAPATKKVGDEDEKCAQAGIDAIKDALEFAD